VIDLFDLFFVAMTFFTVFRGVREFVRGHRAPKRKRLYRAAQRVIQTMFLLDLIAIGRVDNLFVYHRPSKPSGSFTVEYPNHGSSTFITNGDHQLFLLVWIVPFALIAISGLLYQFNRPDWRKVARQKTQL